MNSLLMSMNVTCPYCNSKAKFVSSVMIYGKDHGMIWLCSRFPACNSYVGAHKSSGEPKGTLADRNTRWHRQQAHQQIDWLWKKKIMPRPDVYKSIQFHMNLRPEEAHIGLFNIDQCKELIRVFKENLLIK